MLSHLARFGVIATLVLGTLSAAGCAALEADDETGSIEQEKRVKPNGNEQYTTGTALVSVPNGAPQLATTALVFSMQGRADVRGNLGTPVELPIGTWNLNVAGSNAQTSFGKLEIKGGKTTNLVLPVLAPVQRTTPPAPTSLPNSQFRWGPVYEPIAKNAVQRVPGLRVQGPGSVYAQPIGTNVGIVLVPDATYEIYRTKSTGEEVLDTLLAKDPKVYTMGAVADAWTAGVFDVPQSELTFDLDASDFKSYGVALTWTCTAAMDVAKNYRTPGAYRQDWLLNMTDVATAQKIVGTVGAPGCKYELTLASGVIALDVSKPKVTQAVHFLDVEPVHLTHENGTVRDVQGKFRLLRVPGPGQTPVPLNVDYTYDTNRAVAVAPGTYVVEVRYLDNTGSYKLYKEQVSVP